MVMLKVCNIQARCINNHRISVSMCMLQGQASELLYTVYQNGNIDVFLYVTGRKILHIHVVGPDQL